MQDRKDPNRGPNNTTRVWLIVLGVLVLAWLLWSFSFNPSEHSPDRDELAYSEFMDAVRQGQIIKVAIRGNNIVATMANDKVVHTYAPDDPNLISQLQKHNVRIVARPDDEGGGGFLSILLSWLPMLLLIAVWIYFMRGARMRAGGGPFAFAQSKAKLMQRDRPQVTFEDVAGIDEAKEELEEVVEFLREPHKFLMIGGKIPKGVLLTGPPGTGKTLLARAVAGEAAVPFFSVSGSDFVEMFVGVGASRVRDMFEQAKKNAPCILFVDELDAVGRRRGAGLGGGHDEREQTLNQLLVEMDGFEGNESVIIIAATNRPDVLDPALLRPGRFDRQVVVPLPDVVGREKILGVHMRGVSLAPDVDRAVIARGTPGFSGAELANLVNEAALLAARRGHRDVTMAEFEEAKDKVIMGPERRSLAMTDEEKRLAAYHESGHALVGIHREGNDPVHKVTIVPRGRALGATMALPERDRRGFSRKELEAKIAMMFGGRAAEELIFGRDSVTTGAANDIEQATKLARQMVVEYGFSDEVGPLHLEDNEEEVFLGRAVTQHKKISDKTAEAIDSETRRIVDEAQEEARQLLTTHMDQLHALATALLEHETLTRSDIDGVLRGEAGNVRPLRRENTGRTRNQREKAEKRSAGGSVPRGGKPIKDQMQDRRTGRS